MECRKYPFRGSYYSLEEISKMTGRKISTVKTAMSKEKGKTLDEIFPDDKVIGAPLTPFRLEYPDGIIEELMGVKAVAERFGVKIGTVSNRFLYHDSEVVFFGDVKVTRLTRDKVDATEFTRTWYKDFAKEWESVVTSLRKFDLSGIELVPGEVKK